MNSKTLITESQLQDYIRNEILSLLSPGTIMCLNGELGAGKTTFSKALLKELGYKDSVTSPTYTVEHIYELPDKRLIRHIDLYRFQDGDSLYLSEILQCDEYFCTLIEWAARIPELSTHADIEITLTIKSLEEREIELSS